MTYLNQKLRVFLEVKDKTNISLVRSEGRLKSYSSTYDTRAWCQEVEDRRQSFLEHQARCRTGKCPEGAILPTEVKIKILLDGKNKQLKKLEKKVEYFEELIKIYDSLLTAEQMEKINQEKEALAAKYGMSGEGEVCIGPCVKGTQTYGGYFDLCDDECTCLAEEILCGLLNCIAIKAKSDKPSTKTAGDTSSKEISTGVSQSENVMILKPCICNEEDTEEGTEEGTEEVTVSKSTEQSSESCRCSKNEYGGTSSSENFKSDEPSSHISSQETDQDCECHKYKMEPTTTYICRGPCACG